MKRIDEKKLSAHIEELDRLIGELSKGGGEKMTLAAIKITESEALKRLRSCLVE